jgi:hypothetical protein
LLSTSEAGGGGAQTKVTELAQCTIELGCAAIKTCYACSSEEACNWCHTSTQMLSKDEGRCVSGDCKVDETQASRINARVGLDARYLVAGGARCYGCVDLKRKN